MSLINVEAAKLKLNAENEEFEASELRMKRDELLHKVQDQNRASQEYAKQIEELQASATSTFILRNKVESFSRYIRNEIAKYSGPEQSIAEEKEDDFIQVNAQDMHREKLKLEARIRENCKILCENEDHFIYENNTL